MGNKKYFTNTERNENKTKQTFRSSKMKILRLILGIRTVDIKIAVQYSRDCKMGLGKMKEME